MSYVWFNTMATYKQQVVSEGCKFILESQELYGSNHLGTIKKNTDNPINEILIGNKTYELTDHLGNVRVTFSDIRLWNDLNSDNTINTGELALDITSWNDYYPGGSLMPGRSFESNSYRFGYNAGSEKDDEITGVTGTHFTTYFREFDTRLLVPWSPDPVLQPWQSPYSYMDGNPIWFNDPRGDVVDPSKLGNKERKLYDKTILNLKNGSAIFEIVYNSINSVMSIYSVSAPNLTPNNMKEMITVGGVYNHSSKSIYLNKYQIKKNGPTHIGFGPIAIFEEIWHTGQHLYYSQYKYNVSNLEMETDVRVARAFEIYRIYYTNEKNIISDYGAEDYVRSFVQNKDVQKYFSAILKGEKISKEMEINYRNQVKELGKIVNRKYSEIDENWNPNDVKKYSGETKFFDSIIRYTY